MKRIARLQSASEIAVPAIVVYEIEVGTIQSRQTGKKRRILSELFQEIEVVPFDASAALAAAKIRCELHARGEGIGHLDTLIAGIATNPGPPNSSNPARSNTRFGSS